MFRALNICNPFVKKNKTCVTVTNMCVSPRAEKEYVKKEYVKKSM